MGRNVFYHGLGFKVIGHHALVGWRLLNLIDLAVGVLAHEAHLAATLLLELFHFMRRQGLGLSVVASEDFTITLGQADDLTRRFLLTLNGLGVVLGSRSVSLLGLLFLAGSRLFAALFPEVVDSSSYVSGLAAGFLDRGIDHHLFFWAIIVDSNVDLLFRHLSNHIHLVACRSLILAIRLGQVRRRVILSVAVGVVDLLFLFARKRDNNVFTLSVGWHTLPNG